MKTEIVNFNNEEFGEIRGVRIDDEPWFVGKDVCNAFNDKNPNRSLGRIDDNDKKRMPIKDAVGRDQETIFINESGLYSLLFQMQPQKANKDNADRVKKVKEFKHWVTSEVLPTVRKSGGYISGDIYMLDSSEGEENSKYIYEKAYEVIKKNNASMEIKHAISCFYNYSINSSTMTMNDKSIFLLYNKYNLKDLKDLIMYDYVGYLYIIEYDDCCVKIGYSQNPYERIRTLIHNAETYGNRSIGNFVISQPHTNYVDNEKVLHKYFEDTRIDNSELFNLSLEDVMCKFPELKYSDEMPQGYFKSNKFIDGLMDAIKYGKKYNTQEETI